IENPEMILASNDALAAGARVHGFSVNEYLQFITDEIAALEAEEKEEAEGNHESAVIVTEDNAELLLQTMVDSSANVLNVNSDQVKDNMTLIKEPTALSASTEVTGLTEEQIIMMANHAMESDRKSTRLKSSHLT